MELTLVEDDSLNVVKGLPQHEFMSSVADTDRAKELMSVHHVFPFDLTTGFHVTGNVHRLERREIEVVEPQSDLDRLS